MTKRLTLLHLILLAGLALAGSATIATAVEVSPPEINWQMVGPDVVRFQLHFSNADSTESTLGVSGSMYSQEFGAFLPRYGLIGIFVVPPIEPESFFDVFFDVPLSVLPPSPGGGTGPGLRAPLLAPCPEWNWIGNVDVEWSGEGGVGQINKHYGDVDVCPGGTPSWLHLVTVCAGSATWAVVMNCPGWAVALINNDHTPAPALLPAGWSGYVLVSADTSVPENTQCCFDLNFTCEGETATIDVCAFACGCPTPIQHGTWGGIKARYR